jgi:hypothetical protein
MSDQGSSRSIGLGIDPRYEPQVMLTRRGRPYFQRVRQSPALRNARPTAMFFTRRATRRGFQLAMADTWPVQASATMHILLPQDA